MSRGMSSRMDLAAPDVKQASAQAAGSRTGTLGKAISVLEIVAFSDEPMRFTDILNKSGQPRGSLHRQLSNLVSEGLLTLNPDHSYALGLRLLRFASGAWASNQFRKIAEPHLRQLHSMTGETVHLGVLNCGEVIYLDKVESRQAVRMHSQIGNASPAYCTGVGKAAMAALPDEKLHELVSGLDFRRYTEFTLSGPEALYAEIDDIRNTGIACDREEHEIGITCVAAPIYSADHSFVAAVSVTAPAYRAGEETLAGWAGAVKDTAASIMDDMRTRLGPRA